MLLALRNFALGNFAGGIILALIDSAGGGSLASEMLSQSISVVFETAMFFLVLAVYRVLLRKRGNFHQPALGWGLGIGCKAIDWAWVAGGRMPYVNYVLAPVLAGVVFIVVARRMRANVVG